MSYVGRFPNGTSTPVKILDVHPSITLGCNVYIYQRGNGKNWIGFAASDVPNIENGFLIPSEGIRFSLGPSEQVWLVGEEDGDGDTQVYLLADNRLQF